MSNWSNEWSNAHNSAPQQALKAKPNCCEEASTASHNFYIPCNKPATKIVGWKGRSDNPIRMCDMCADHNVHNRGGYVVKDYDQPAQQAWPEQQHVPPNPGPSNPWDAMNEDQLLLLWDDMKKAIETAKQAELELRKYIVNREFPKKQEGMNTKELGNGYQLKAAVKYNYNLADNDKVEDCLNKIANLGNQGAFIADRLVSWKPSFLLTEFRQLVEDKEKGSQFAAKCLDIVYEMLTVTEAAPTLEIKAPKTKK